jgi:prolyl oligopeptidase
VVVGSSVTEDLWLEDAEDPKVIAWAKEQSREAIRSLRGLSRQLYPRIRRYHGVRTLLSVAASKDGCYTLSVDSSSYKVRLLGRDGVRRLLVDSRRLGRDMVIPPFGLQVRREGDCIAYTFTRGGGDEGVTRIIDIRDGETLDELSGIIGSIAWIDRNRYYYVRHYRREATPDGVGPPATRVFLREDGREEMVFGNGVPTNHFIAVQASSDGSKALVTISYGWTRSTVHAGDLRDPGGWVKLMESEAPITPLDYVNGEYYLVAHERGMGAVVRVDGDGKKVGVVEAPHPLQGAAVAGDRLVCQYLVNAHARLALYTLGGRLVKSFVLKPPGTLLGPNQATTYGAEAYFAYSSFTIPYRVYRLRDGRLDVLESRELGIDVRVRDLWAESRDGTKVHAFLASRRGTRPRKLLVYGYGGFRISLTPTFMPHIIPFLEGGGDFVMCNLRGGLEYGEEWHREGMREKKINVFHDFIAVLERLRAGGARVVAMGASNGGLLVAATLTMRPELLDGAIIGYPVLDLLRFHRLHVGRAWVPEYGDPDDPRDAEFLRRYSPYHNLREGVVYPPTFIYTGLHDDRVHPSHAYRFYAKMRRLGAPALLRVEASSGHAGARPQARVRERADIMAFAYKVLSLTLGPGPSPPSRTRHKGKSTRIHS